MNDRPAQENSQPLVAALTAAAREMATRPVESTERVLERIVAGAVHTVPGAEHAGISMLGRDGRVTSHAPSSDVARRVDELQTAYQEGPCVSALWEQHTVLVDDAADESGRWPAFAPEAAALGVVSILSFQLFASSDTLGALNLYSGRRAGFDDQSQTLGALFASHAALALGRAQDMEQLHRALATRDLIGQAKGILMERFDLDASAAFEMLVRSSQDTNMKLVDVARWLADERPSWA